MALNVKPKEYYPKNRLTKIEKILNNQQKEREVIAELERKYKEIIAKADNLFDSKKYEDAMVAYQSASNINPKETYPNVKINEIKNIFEKQRKLKDLKYKNIIASADNFMNKEQYSEAKAKYIESLGIKPGEVYPKNKLAEIQNALAKLDRENAAKQKIDNLYAQQIDVADNLYNKKDYLNAKGAYQKALTIKKNEQYPKARIKRIDNLLEKMQLAQNSKSSNIKKSSTIDVKAKKGKLHELSFKSSSERKAYLSRLAQSYPEGVTIENYEQNNQKIKRVIVNYNGIATEYRQVKHSWGAIFFFKNDKTISKNVFEIETKK